MDEFYRKSNEYFYICEKGMFREAADKSLDIYMFVTVPIIYIIAMLISKNLGYNDIYHLNILTVFLFVAYVEMMMLFWLVPYKFSKQKVFINRVNKENNTSFVVFDEAKQFVLTKIIKQNSNQYLDYYKKIEETKKEWDKFSPSNQEIVSNIIFYLKNNILTKLLGKISSIALTSLIAAFVNEKYPNFWGSINFDELSLQDLLLILIVLGMLYVGLMIILYFASEIFNFIFKILGLVMFDKKRSRNNYIVKYLQMDLIKYCSVE